MDDEEDFYDQVVDFPNPQARQSYKELVGLDEIKTNLVNETHMLLVPQSVHQWSQEHYDEHLALVEDFLSRAPLIVFSGDVGTGKTALAESFPDVIARQAEMDMQLFRMSLTTRGSGAVGQMTTFITNAFQEVIDQAKSLRPSKGDEKPQGGIVLLIDEADALAQSREFDQMHHEDKAGVNSLIRGLDTLQSFSPRLPVLVLMCTNRDYALDPAIKRRASSVFQFSRPDYEQRLALLKDKLRGAGLSSETLKVLAERTGVQDEEGVPFSYSDMTQKLLPRILLEAFQEGSPIKRSHVLKVVETMDPTPPFSIKNNVTQ